MSQHHRVNALSEVANRVARNMPDHPKAKAMQAEINRLAAGAVALDNVRKARNPTETQDAHIKRLGMMARKYDNESTAAINRLSSIAREAQEDVQRRIDEKVSLKPDAFAAEIRAAFRTMKRAEKMTLLGELARENRGAELAAIVKAPPTLTGISEDDRARFETAIYSIHANELLAERDGLNEVLETALIGVNTASGITRAFTDPAEIARIERAEAASAAAGEAFDQALQ